MTTIYFPAHEIVDEHWAFEALLFARRAWLRERGFLVILPVSLREREGWQQWSYTVEL